jgi:hypothetical protein
MTGPSESKFYNRRTNSCVGVACGHYTQLVWGNTREVGCGVGSCQKIQFRTTLVCKLLARGQLRRRTDRSREVAVDSRQGGHLDGAAGARADPSVCKIAATQGRAVDARVRGGSVGAGAGHRVRGWYVPLAEPLIRGAAAAAVSGLPIVATLAWYHGDRGRQDFTRVELGVLAVLAAIGMMVILRAAHTTAPKSTQT